MFSSVPALLPVSLLLALQASFGARPYDLVLPSQPMTAQVAAVWAGPALPLKHLPESLVLEAHCRRAGCAEAAALVRDGQGQVRGLALRHFRCHAGSQGQTQCQAAPVLSVWIVRHGRSAAHEAELGAALDQWAAAYGFRYRELNFVRAAP